MGSIYLKIGLLSEMIARWNFSKKPKD